MCFVPGISVYDMLAYVLESRMLSFDMPMCGLCTAPVTRVIIL